MLPTPLPQSSKLSTVQQPLRLKKYPRRLVTDKKDVKTESDYRHIVVLPGERLAIIDASGAVIQHDLKTGTQTHFPSSQPIPPTAAVVLNNILWVRHSDGTLKLWHIHADKLEAIAASQINFQACTLKNEAADGKTLQQPAGVQRFQVTVENGVDPIIISHDKNDIKFWDLQGRPIQQGVTRDAQGYTLLSGNRKAMLQKDSLLIYSTASPLDFVSDSKTAIVERTERIPAPKDNAEVIKWVFSSDQYAFICVNAGKGFFDRSHTIKEGSIKLWFKGGDANRQMLTEWVCVSDWDKHGMAMLQVVGFPDERWLAASVEEKSILKTTYCVKILDVWAKKVLHTLPEDARCLAALPKKHLAIATMADEVKIYDVAGVKPILVATLPGAIRAVKLIFNNKNGADALIVVQANAEVQVWEDVYKWHADHQPYPRHGATWQLPIPAFRADVRNLDTSQTIFQVGSLLNVIERVSNHSVVMNFWSLGNNYGLKAGQYTRSLQFDNYAGSCVVANKYLLILNSQTNEYEIWADMCERLIEGPLAAFSSPATAAARPTAVDFSSLLLIEQDGVKHRVALDYTTLENMSSRAYQKIIRVENKEYIAQKAATATWATTAAASGVTTFPGNNTDAKAVLAPVQQPLPVAEPPTGALASSNAPKVSADPGKEITDEQLDDLMKLTNIPGLGR